MIICLNSWDGFWEFLHTALPLLTHCMSIYTDEPSPPSKHSVDHVAPFVYINHPLLSIMESGSGGLSCIQNLNKSSLFSVIVTYCFLSEITIVSGCFLLFCCRNILFSNFSWFLLYSSIQEKIFALYFKISKRWIVSVHLCSCFLRS